MRLESYGRRVGAGAGLALAGLLVAGCGGAGGGDGEAPKSTPSSSAATRSASPAAAQPLVEMTVTGGIAGVHNRLLVRADGSYSTTTKTGAGRTGRMTPAELAELRRALEDADFARLPRNPTGSPIADGFTYEISYAGHTVTTSDPGLLPALRDVLAALPED
ncbi:protealysin inhibitor emfourin [Streptomyces sp. NPDC020681]|uniref:protealysin inhibitor emfourin n=1 Tax=Streptomyces sp. NPDC020681 TaxID=3365083 RepID=UPI0037970EB7